MELELVEQLRNAIEDQEKQLKMVASGSEEEARIVKNICDLIAQLNKIDQLDLEAVDKEERRALDREKNEKMHELEIWKSTLNIKRAGFELIKIIVPGMIGGAFYLEAQKRVLKFEETGRIVTTAGRDLRLPNLFTFWKK